jgi:regulatory protein
MFAPAFTSESMNSRKPGLNPKIYNSALKLLSIRAHGTEELRLKLLKKGDAEEVETVLAELLKKKYLDDREFSFMRARSCCIHKRWGKLRIRQDLKNLGLNDKIAEASLEKVLAEFPDAGRLQKVISSYQKLHGRPSTIKDVKKLFDRCIRLGYTPEMVRNQLNSLFASISWD